MNKKKTENIIKLSNEIDGSSIKLRSNEESKSIIIKLKKLTDDAVIPTYAHVDENGNNLGDIGLDLVATSVEWDESIDCYIYHTGLAFESTKHVGVFLLPRSSNRKTNCYLANSIGTIDSPIYRGEIIFCYKPRTSTFLKASNYAKKSFFYWLENDLKNGIFNIFRLKKIFKRAHDEYYNSYQAYIEHAKELEFAPYEVGDKIGQMIAFDVKDVSFEIVDKLSETVRGENGFGSTDK